MSDKSTWKKVKLGDVVCQLKDSVNIDTCGLEHYLGGEHFNTNDLHVNGKGIIAGSTIGPAFTMRFKPCHVLIVSRNPHLRKMAVADFEGICSNVTYVCETKSANLLQDFLPFIIRSSDFWAFAEANKRGSTNFYLNWSDFAQYEFLLPPIEEQKRIAEILWAADAVLENYKRCAKELDGLYFSLLDEAFNKLFKKYTCCNLSKVGEWKSGGTPSRKQVSFWNGNIPWVSPKDMKFDTISSSIEKITEEALHNTTLHLLPPKTVLFVVRGMILAHTFPVAISLVPVTINQDMKAILVNKNYLPEYIFYFLKFYSQNILGTTEESSHGTKKLSTERLMEIEIPEVTVSRQKELVQKMDLVTQNLENITHMVNAAQETLSSLINHYLGGAN